MKSIKAYSYPHNPAFQKQVNDLIAKFGDDITGWKLLNCLESLKQRKPFYSVMLIEDAKTT